MDWKGKIGVGSRVAWEFKIKRPLFYQVLNFFSNRDALVFLDEEIRMAGIYMEHSR